jgi:hypothetical protein
VNPPSGGEGDAALRAPNTESEGIVIPECGALRSARGFVERLRAE